MIPIQCAAGTILLVLPIAPATGVSVGRQQ
jgi:hypothetical protein